MHRALARTGLAGLAVLAATVFAVTAVPTTAATAPAAGGNGAGRQVVACPERPGPYARCLTRYVPQTAVNRTLAAGDDVDPAGWGAGDLAAAYRLPVGTAATATVAVSVAYDAPDLEADLATYRAQYGLPPCTTANGCFRTVNQDGAATPLPSADPGWAVEATLDVSMISAACPSCHILVVAGDDPSFANLAATEDTAVRLGADVVSNSYGGREGGAALRYAGSYRHDGHVVLAASGDSGYTAGSFPAVLDSVVAVGGTTLVPSDDPRGYAETAWQRGGSGCSAYVARPAWQPTGDCGMRTVADVSAVAAGVAIYQGAAGGWLTASGTSASAPLVAGVYGLAGHAATATPGDLYRHADALFDVTAGANDPAGDRSRCGHDYLCQAGPGYDAPTGLGTPNGLGAF